MDEPAALLTVDKYIRQDLCAGRRQEYINGQLFEMPGDKDINNELAGEFYFLLRSHLLPRGYMVYTHDVKVAIPGGQKYYYPNVFATAEPKTTDNQYIKYTPAIIVEVVSETSHALDYVTKYLDYILIPSLQYYLIAEPETLLVTVYARTGTEWHIRKYTKEDDLIALPLLELMLPMREIYRLAKRRLFF